MPLFPFLDRCWHVTFWIITYSWLLVVLGPPVKISLRKWFGLKNVTKEIFYWIYSMLPVLKVIKRQPIKMVKHNKTIRWQQPTNCLSVTILWVCRLKCYHYELKLNNHLKKRRWLILRYYNLCRMIWKFCYALKIWKSCYALKVDSLKKKKFPYPTFTSYGGNAMNSCDLKAYNLVERTYFEYMHLI